MQDVSLSELMQLEVSGALPKKTRRKTASPEVKTETGTKTRKRSTRQIQLGNLRAEFERLCADNTEGFYVIRRKYIDEPSNRRYMLQIAFGQSSRTVGGVDGDSRIEPIEVLGKLPPVLESEVIDSVFCPPLPEGQSSREFAVKYAARLHDCKVLTYRHDSAYCPDNTSIVSETAAHNVTGFYGNQAVKVFYSLRSWLNNAPDEIGADDGLTAASVSRSIPVSKTLTAARWEYATLGSCKVSQDPLAVDRTQDQDELTAARIDRRFRQLTAARIETRNGLTETETETAAYNAGGLRDLAPLPSIAWNYDKTGFYFVDPFNAQRFSTPVSEAVNRTPEAIKRIVAIGKPETLTAASLRSYKVLRLTYKVKGQDPSPAIVRTQDLASYPRGLRVLVQGSWFKVKTETETETAASIANRKMTAQRAFDLLTRPNAIVSGLVFNHYPE